MGIVDQLKGDMPRAIQAYEEVLTIDPRSPVAANNLAYLYSEHGGDQEKALQLAQIAKETAPDDPSISDTLGWILYKRGVYQRALALLKDSAAKLPDSPEIHYHLGMTYHKLKDGKAARQSLERALALNPQFPGADQARRTLAEIGNPPAAATNR
jgi:tetratricopeptide (TPR) repeat protein